MLLTGSTWEKLFQSTPPVWGATAGGNAMYYPIDISIHAPRVGGDVGGL